MIYTRCKRIHPHTHTHMYVSVCCINGSLVCHQTSDLMSVVKVTSWGSPWLCLFHDVTRKTRKDFWSRANPFSKLKGGPILGDIRISIDIILPCPSLSRSHSVQRRCFILRRLLYFNITSEVVLHEILSQCGEVIHEIVLYMPWGIPLLCILPSTR